MAVASLELLGGFRLTCSAREVEMPVSAQRVLAMLALSGRSLRRSYVAGMLWPDSSEERANGSLRSALWRIRKIDADLVRVTTESVSISDDVTVDVRILRVQASEVVEGQAEPSQVQPGWFEAELLPDWYEDWVLFERERMRQLRMHALEALAAQLAAAGRFGKAIEAAMMAIQCEVLRESAHRVLIETHIAEGNISEAMRHYELYRSIMKAQLGVDPTMDLQSMVSSLTPHPG